MRQAKIVITVNLSNWMDVPSLITKLMDKLPWIVCTGGCSIEKIEEQQSLTPEPKSVKLDELDERSVYERNMEFCARCD